MLDALVHTLADKEYYAPPATMADPGPRFAPARVPSGWRRADRDIWTVWSDGRARRAEQGWKIHVSARLDRAQRVLDTVAEICFAEGAAFKHVSARTFFMVLHHKHAGRPQAGKFCAIYPPDTETARRLLGLLSDALRDEDGPYILSDRRFGDSRTVHYRYGAFSARTALRTAPPDSSTSRSGSAATPWPAATSCHPAWMSARRASPASCSTLAGGRAGVGLTWLALHRLTRDVRHLEKAAAAGDAIAALVDRGADELIATLGPSDAHGLHHGRSGLAQFLHHLAQETGDERYRAVGVRLLYEELDRAIQMDDGTLSFADDAVTQRAMPYLAVGAAGVGTALSHYVAAGRDERLREALPRVAAGTTLSTWTKEAGLYEGLAGLSWFLTHYAEADCHADTDSALRARTNARRAATGLLKYAVPHTCGVRFLGSGAHRFSADLSSGGAGVLLALRRFLDGPGGGFFTLSPGAASPARGG